MSDWEFKSDFYPKAPTEELLYKGKIAPRWAFKIVARTLVVIRALQEAGFTGEDLRIMSATAMAESGGKPEAVHVNKDGSNDLGPMQINSVHGVPDSVRRSFWASAMWAFDKWIKGKPGKQYGPWNAYTSGAYTTFLPFVDMALTYMKSPVTI